MKNLLSKLLKTKSNNPELKIGEKLDIYISVFEIFSKDKQDKISTRHFKRGIYVMLEGIKGIYLIDNLSEFGHTAQYKISLIRKNIPKDYIEDIEKINNYIIK